MWPLTADLLIHGGRNSSHLIPLLSTILVCTWLALEEDGRADGEKERLHNFIFYAEKLTGLYKLDEHAPVILVYS